MTAENDELYPRAVELVKERNNASVAGLQRHLGIGYNRACRLIERMEDEGVVSKWDPARGGRKVL